MGPYSVVDVLARWNGEEQRVRLPVFAGDNPADTRPGAFALRLTSAGVSQLGRMVEEGIEDGLDGAFEDASFPLGDGGLELAIDSFDVGAFSFDLGAEEEGLVLSLQLMDLSLGFSTDFSLGDRNFDVPGLIALPEVDLALTLDLRVARIGRS